jgi:hypothetical protein
LGFLPTLLVSLFTFHTLIELFFVRRKSSAPVKVKLSDINESDGDIDEAFAVSALNASLTLLIRCRRY